MDIAANPVASTDRHREEKFVHADIVAGGISPDYELTVR
jgi:hypothetical protein